MIWVVSCNLSFQRINKKALINYFYNQSTEEQSATLLDEFIYEQYTE